MCVYVCVYNIQSRRTYINKQTNNWTCQNIYRETHQRTALNSEWNGSASPLTCVNNELPECMPLSISLSLSLKCHRHESNDKLHLNRTGNNHLHKYTKKSQLKDVRHLRGESNGNGVAPPDVNHSKASYRRNRRTIICPMVN